MINEKRILALIPARGGSKRLPKKNILPLCGKPLIAWTIEDALKSSYIDEVVVSSDCDEIIDISKKSGASIFFKRPDFLATDSATSNDVIVHAIDELLLQGHSFDIIIILQPTSPCRSIDNLDEAIEQLEKQKADGVISVCQSEHSPIWANTLPSNNSLENFIKNDVLVSSQSLPVYYRLNGALYCFDVKALMRNSGIFYGKNVFAYEMTQESSIDIDSKLDFDIARIIMATRDK